MNFLSTQAEERVIQESLLKVFSGVLPHMDSTASAFAKSLQVNCTSLLSRPNQLGEKVVWRAFGESLQTGPVLR